MADHTPTPWILDDDDQTIYVLSKDPFAWPGGGIYVAYTSDFGCNSPYRANAAFILKAANSHDALVEALQLARKRLEYYGTISDRRHFDHDLAEVYPKIDAALARTSGIREI